MKRVVYISLFVAASLAGWLVGALTDSSPEPLDTSEDERRQLEELALEVARLRGEVAGPGGEASAPNHQDTPDLDFDELEARERELGQRRAEVIAAAAAHEAVDPAWASTTEELIAERFATHGPPDGRLLSTTCKTTLCVVEVEAPRGRGSVGYQEWSTVPSLQRGFALRPSSRERDGLVRSVVYLARDGHPLPK